jgi:methionyl-tRNA formyltransferase
MRTILIGQAAFAQRVLDGLRGRGHEVAALYCPPDASGGKPDPAKARALDLRIPIHQHRSLKGPDVAREFSDYAADLGILAYVTQIVPASVFAAPRLGSVCFHPSLLPRYRGGSAIPWQIIKGETRTGVSVFWVDPGIDTGPVLVQKEASIGPDDTAGSLYYNTLFELGVATLLEAVDQVAAGTAARIPQDESQASYDPLCRDEHAQIDWSRPVGEVYDLIRGCDPQPGAYSMRSAAMVRMYDARRVEHSDARPGLVAAVDESGVTIGAAGGAVRIGRMRLGDKKVTALDAAAALGLTVGRPVAD